MPNAAFFKPGEEDKQEIIFDESLMTDQEKRRAEAELFTHKVLSIAFPGELPSFNIVCSDTKSSILFPEDLSAKLGLPPIIEKDGPPTCAYAELCICLEVMKKNK